MKFIQATMLACVLCFSAPVLADQASEAAAERLLLVMDMQAAMGHVVDAAIDAPELSRNDPGDTWDYRVALPRFTASLPAMPGAVGR